MRQEEFYCQRRQNCTSATYNSFFATLALNCCEIMHIRFVMSAFLFVFPPSNRAEHAVTSRSSQCRLLLL